MLLTPTPPCVEVGAEAVHATRCQPVGLCQRHRKKGEGMPSYYKRYVILVIISRYSMLAAQALMAWDICTALMCMLPKYSTVPVQYILWMSFFRRL